MIHMRAQSPSLSAIVQAATAGRESPKEQAVALHNWIRDNVAFGFNAWWDMTPPERTVQQAVGHCNPKGELFVALLREAGIKAHLHAVTIPSGILHGVLPNVPPELTHTFTEVELDGRTLRVDSYIVDTRLFEAAQRKLRETGRQCGWGVHVNGRCAWDGETDSFSQFADPATMLIEDLGRVGGMRDVWFARQVNARLEELRQGAAAA